MSEVTKEGGVGSLSQMERSALSELSTCLKLRALEIKEDKFFGVGLDGIQSIRTYVSKVSPTPPPPPPPPRVSLYVRARDATRPGIPALTLCPVLPRSRPSVLP